MILSMTGFGKSVCELPNKNISIEIRSLNGKQLDVNTKIHPIFRDKDMEIRNLAQNSLGRGKVDISLNYEMKEGGKAAKLNRSVIASYYEQLIDITKEMELAVNEQMFQSVLRLPDVFSIEKDEIAEEEWKTIKSHIQNALDNLVDFRIQEGKALYTDITKRIEKILEHLADISNYEKQRIETIKERIQNNLNELVQDNIDKNRFEQELIYYIEKLDITEEKVRLKNHCNYFTEVINQDEAVGKKLGFIAQEIGREINTIGSKSNQADMQRIVVLMKDELEKIKEQLLNVL